MLGNLLPFQNKTICLFFVLSLVALCLSAQQQTPIQNKTLVVFSFLNKENENQKMKIWAGALACHWKVEYISGHILESMPQSVAEIEG